MRKIVIVFVVCCLLSSLGYVTFRLTQDEPTLKLGIGVVVSASATDAVAAQGENSAKNGKGSADITVAAVLVDKDGNIVKAVVDVMQLALEYTPEGKAISNAEFKSKHELGDDYGMKAPWGSEKEWYEHANAFDAACAGKTVAEMSGIVGADGKATDPDLLSAGCTIAIGDFVKALGKLQG